jgi:four helix bundle protein
MNEESSKSEYRISKQIRIPKSKTVAPVESNKENKPYDLEDRTFEFAKASRAFVKRLVRTMANIEDAKQFVRASGSVGANYIEANESVGKKDFVMKIKTSRREAKECGYWLRLLDCDGQLEPTKTRLLAEATELMKIFGATVRKSEG